MADTLTIEYWKIDPVCNTPYQYIITRDEDFGVPYLYKIIYAIYITYKQVSAVQMNQAVNYVIDGGTTFVNTYLPSYYLQAINDWDYTKVEFTQKIQCQSIRFKIILDYINDIAIEYRTTYRRLIP